MNLNLNYEGFEEYLVDKRQNGNYVQYRFRFPNDYGASVVKDPYTYGGRDDKWELAVIKWEDDDYELEYDTYITNDIVGWLDDKGVRDLLKQIQEL